MKSTPITSVVFVRYIRRVRVCVITSEDDDRILGALVLGVGEICADFKMVSYRTTTNSI